MVIGDVEGSREKEDGERCRGFDGWETAVHADEVVNWHVGGFVVGGAVVVDGGVVVVVVAVVGSIGVVDLVAVDVVGEGKLREVASRVVGRLGDSDSVAVSWRRRRRRAVVEVVVVVVELWFDQSGAADRGEHQRLDGEREGWQWRGAKSREAKER